MGKLKCMYCGFESHYLGLHLEREHNVTVRRYLKEFPKAGTISPQLATLYEKKATEVHRKGEHVQKIEGIYLTVDLSIPSKVCFPLPLQYHWATQGDAEQDTKQIVVALKKKRSTYIWGMPGCGKDAIVKAYSAITHTPARSFHVVKNLDVSSWFWSKSFNREGTYWEEGSLYEILTNGYEREDGSRVGYLVLITDFDRMNQSQTELFRLILDPDRPAVMGPKGIITDVYPGTTIVATGNTAGAGDFRGRSISSSPIDASIMDRFERAFEMHYLSWEDERIVLKEKFPRVYKAFPEFFETLGKLTVKIRTMVQEEKYYAEFSHRTLCNWITSIQDSLEERGAEDTLPIEQARCWLDKLPDVHSRLEVARLLDAHFQSRDKRHLHA